MNEFCQSHEVANLFVVDGSFMPTSGGAPTTLTIAANSFRVADFVISNARSGALARHPRRLVGIGGPPGEACAAENIGVTAQQPAGGRE